MSGKQEGAIDGKEPAGKRRILHLEDNERDRILLEETIADGGLNCEFTHAATQSEFETALNSPFDLIISDFTLPGFNGMAALAAARNVQPETPFLFLSGTIGEERAVESLKSGAIDYVLKTHMGRLVPAIERALRDAHERAHRKQLEMQLRQAQKMEAIGQLAGGIAHDFNNLLAIIQGNAGLVMMRDEPIDDDIRECLKQINVATERAANLTRQLLAFGRKQSLQQKPIQIGMVVCELAKMLKRVIGAHIKLECIVPTAPILVQADLSMMEQVLINLVVNARDAMPQGGELLITTERVTINNTYAQMHPEARAGDFACLTVRDSGTGIAPEHLARIFEPFFTTKDIGKGTGLGLATVYGIVKQHQGWIEVSTRLGHGTTFKVFLPAAASPNAKSAKENAQPALRGGDECILLAEDDSALRSLTRKILESFGYEVLEAATGQQALTLASAEAARIDLLLAGLVMPDGIMGHELAERLRALNSKLCVIYMSGFSKEATDPRLYRPETDTFLQKPFSSHVLIDEVRRCLDKN